MQYSSLFWDIYFGDISANLTLKRDELIGWKYIRKNKRILEALKEEQTNHWHRSHLWELSYFYVSFFLLLLLSLSSSFLQKKKKKLASACISSLVWLRLLQRSNAVFSALAESLLVLNSRGFAPRH